MKAYLVRVEGVCGLAALCALATLAASCTPDAPAPARLEFRYAPLPGQIKPTEADRYRELLAGGRMGSAAEVRAWPEQWYCWVPSALPDGLGGADLFRGEYHGRQYILVARGSDGMMAPGELAAWGLANVKATTDETWAPAVAFELDEPGTVLFSYLTRWPQGRRLVTLVDGKAVSAPVAKRGPAPRGMIAGLSTPEEAQRMASALAAGMPPQPMPGAQQWAAQSAEFTRRARAALRQTLAPKEPQTLELAAAVEFLREKTGANFHVNWRALAVAGVDPKTPVTLRHNTPVTGEKALQSLLADLSRGGDKQLAYGIDCGVVTISTPKELAATARTPAFVNCGTDAKSLAARLSLRWFAIRPDFLDEQQLDLVVDYLGEVANVPIHVKWEALQNADVTNRSMVCLKLDTVAERVMQCALEDLSTGATRLGYVIQDGKVILSTVDDLRRNASGR
ncbi:MAG: hypothetical protein NTV86_17505 [Planctomycetota bacterium]|nr:hypothetical protein [Planctomycetota bacterium]